MNYRRKYRAICVVVVFVVMSSICVLASEELDKKVFTDHLGRTVIIEGEPQRVIALTRAYMEELFEIGVTPVAKVDEYNNRLEGVSLPSVGRQSNPDLEAIYAMQPDLIIANTRQHSNLLELLEQTGAAVFFVNPNKVDVDPLTDRIIIFGSLLGREDFVRDYMRELDELCESLREALQPYNYKTGLIVQGGTDSIRAAMPTGLYGSLLNRLGIDNIVVAGHVGAGQSTWVNFDLETLLKLDPSVILIRAAGSSEGNNAVLLANFTENPQWQSLTAIQTGRIFVLPARVNPGNISNAEAIRVTFETLTSDWIED